MASETRWTVLSKILKPFRNPKPGRRNASVYAINKCDTRKKTNSVPYALINSFGICTHSAHVQARLHETRRTRAPGAICTTHKKVLDDGRTAFFFLSSAEAFSTLRDGKRALEIRTLLRRRAQLETEVPTHRPSGRICREAP